MAAPSFELRPQQLRASDFGVELPSPEQIFDGAEGRRQHILLETLAALEKASATARYHELALRNLQRWAQQARPSPAAATAAAAAGSTAAAATCKSTSCPQKHTLARTAATAGLRCDGCRRAIKSGEQIYSCEPCDFDACDDCGGTDRDGIGAAACAVLVLPGDWGEVTLELTRRYGALFASLNMANAYGPGGGYTHGMVAQEENMFRRTDCHFSLNREEIDGDDEEYVPEVTTLLNAAQGRVYLDVARPRVCIRGPEERELSDLGYRWLDDDEVFPFFELRSAAVDLRGGGAFSRSETRKRVAAQLDTLVEQGVRHVVLSAFGCGAFRNPADEVAAVYRQELQKRAAKFDVVGFGIFHAGYGPDNFAPFARAFADWPK